MNGWESITDFRASWSAERNPRHKILNSYAKESEITEVGNVEQMGLYGFSFVIWIWTFASVHVRTTTHHSSLLLSTYCPHWTTERTQWCSNSTATMWDCIALKLNVSCLYNGIHYWYIGMSSVVGSENSSHQLLNKLCNLSFSMKISDSISNWGSIWPNILPQFFNL